MAITRGQKIAGVIAVAILVIVGVKTQNDPAPASKYASASCEPGKFRIVEKNAERSANSLNTLYIKASVRNDNAMACGVRIETTLTSKEGHRITTDKAWPASVSNIPPGAVFPFEVMIRGEIADLAVGGDYRLDPIEAKQW